MVTTRILVEDCARVRAFESVGCSVSLGDKGTEQGYGSVDRDRSIVLVQVCKIGTAFSCAIVQSTARRLDLRIAMLRIQHSLNNCFSGSTICTAITTNLCGGVIVLHESLHATHRLLFPTT